MSRQAKRLANSNVDVVPVPKKIPNQAAAGGQQLYRVFTDERLAPILSEV